MVAPEAGWWRSSKNMIYVQNEVRVVAPVAVTVEGVWCTTSHPSGSYNVQDQITLKYLSRGEREFPFAL